MGSFTIPNTICARPSSSASVCLRPWSHPPPWSCLDDITSAPTAPIVPTPWGLLVDTCSALAADVPLGLLVSDFSCSVSCKTKRSTSEVIFCIVPSLSRPLLLPRSESSWPPPGRGITAILAAATVDFLSSADFCKFVAKRRESLGRNCAKTNKSYQVQTIEPDSAHRKIIGHFDSCEVEFSNLIPSKLC